MEHIESFGKYNLHERVAIGGMAEIFRATIKGIGGFERTVAIKRMHRHLGEDEDLAKTLIDEARLAVQLNHANIGQVFDLGRIDQQYFMVMEFIEGSDFHGILRRIRDQNRLIPPAIACHAVAEMLKALDYAHNALGPDHHPLNIVHRDVSPQNLMLNTQGEIKLVDFGIAKARMRLLETQAGIIKGKFYYMSPEQAFGKPLDRRTDIFAAGMVLYELLAGRPAYDEVNDLALLKRVRSCDFPSPRSFRLDLDPELDKIVLKALTRELDQRYQTAREFQNVLQDYLQRTSGQVSSYQMAEFLKGLMSPELYQTQLPQGLTDRKEYQKSENSLIFDASHLALDASDDGDFFEDYATDVSGPHPFQDVPLGEDTEHEHYNPFAADEATYVFSRDDDGAINPLNPSAPEPWMSHDPPTIQPTHQPPLQVPGGQPQRPQAHQHAPVGMSLAGPQPFINAAHSGPQQAVGRPAPLHVSGPQPFANPYEASLDTVTTPLEPHLRAQAAAAHMQAAAAASGRAVASGAAIPFGPPPARAGAGAAAPMFPQNAPARPPETKTRQIDQLKARFLAIDRRILIGVGAAVMMLLLVVIIISSSGDSKPPEQPIVATPAVVAPELEFVSVTVVSRPSNAQVFVDGALAGSTPVSIPRQIVGKRVKLKVTRDGHEPWEQEILVSPNSADVIAELKTLKKSLGVIKIVTNPPGLRVEVDEQYAGKSPTQAGDLDTTISHTVVASLGDGVSKQEVVSWKAGDDNIKQITLVFEEDERNVERDLPEPPRADKTKRRPSRRTPSAKKEEVDDKSLNVWGAQGSSKDDEEEEDAPEPAKTKTKPAKNLNVWGNSKDQPKAKNGYLTVNIKGGSGKVYVDDKLVSSKTPLNRYSLSPGAHTIKVYYPDLKRYSAPLNVSINPGLTSRHTFVP